MVINHYNRSIFKTVGLVGKFMDEIIREGMPMDYGYLDAIMGEKDVSAFIFQFFTDYHGDKIKKSAPSPEQAQKRMDEIRDYIQENLSHTFRMLGISDYSDSIYNIHGIVEPILEDTLEVFEGWLSQTSLQRKTNIHFLGKEKIGRHSSTGRAPVL